MANLEQSFGLYFKEEGFFGKMENILVGQEVLRSITVSCFTKCP